MDTEPETTPVEETEQTETQTEVTPEGEKVSE